MAGAFGGKGVIAPEVAAVAASAIRLGRPLKWTEDRLENFLAAYQGRGIEGDVELALDGHGTMLALRARLWADLGGYLYSTTAIPPHTMAMLVTGCYRIAAAEVHLVGARTHKVPTGPYRGAGRPDAAYLLERIVDDAARVVGIDRIELRRRNLIASFPHRTPLGFTYDSGDYGRCLELAVELGLGDETPPEEAAGHGGERLRGAGIVMYVERAGGQWESAEIELAPSGRVVIASSASPHGQGHETTFAQIAATRLGLEMDRIVMRFGDSAMVPRGVGTFGSRSVAMAGSAIVVASDKLISRAARLAAHLLEADESEVRLRMAGSWPGSVQSTGASLRARELPAGAPAAGNRGGSERWRAALPEQVFSGRARTVQIERATGRLRVLKSLPWTMPAR